MNCACAGRSSQLKNPAEYFKIDSAKKRWRLQVALEAMAVKEGTRVTKNNLCGLKSRRRIFREEKIYFSGGLQQNTRQDMSVS